MISNFKSSVFLLPIMGLLLLGSIGVSVCYAEESTNIISDEEQPLLQDENSLFVSNDNVNNLDENTLDKIKAKSLDQNSDDSSIQQEKVVASSQKERDEVSEEVPEKAGLIETSNGLRYHNDDGSYATNEWKTVDTETYYFNSDGYAVTYEKYIDNKHYYFNGSGVMQTGWVTWKADGTKSYFDSDGVALSGWCDLDGKRYYFDSDNKDRSARWETVIDGDRYYFGSDCSMYTGILTWKADGTKSFFGSDGVAVSGWKTIEDNTYYFDDKNGRSLVYEKYIDNKHYYFNGSGVMQTGWVTWKADGTKSYFDSDGVALSGWCDLDGKRYYFDSDNKDRSARWETVIDGDRYYFGSDCSMYTGILTWKADGTKSFFGSDGVMATSGWQTWNGKWYYIDPSTERAVKYYKIIDGKQYYFNSECERYTGILTWKADGTKSFFGSDGVMATSGWQTWNGKKYYIDSKTQRAVKYLQKINGNYYYFNADCSMHVGWIKWKSDGKYSYFKSNGVMATGTYAVDGVKYNFGNSGKIDSIDPVRADMVSKAQKYSSGTKYLILVDLSAHKVGVFNGKKNNWSLQYYWSCVTGASSTPTIKGKYKTTGFTRPSLSTDSRAIYCTQIWGGYFFHSILASESELGKSLSHGCIRLPYSAANWIYKNINAGTTVYIYK